MRKEKENKQTIKLEPSSYRHNISALQWIAKKKKDILESASLVQVVKKE